jgi:protein TonB
MRRNTLFAIIGSFLLHSSIAFSGLLFKDDPVEEIIKEETPTIELAPMPTLEPEPPDVVETSEAAASSEPADLAPPMQADTPSVQMDSPFVQQIQPPPPPGMNKPTGSITIPTGRPATGGGTGGIKNVFDLASLDQKPVATFQSRPTHPFELKRARINGQATVMFIVDSSGDVREPSIVETSHREFGPEAMKAVLKWKFRPGKKSGAAVNTRMQITIQFNANQS